MELEFRVELKANYPEDYKRKELVIGVYNTNLLDEEGEYQKIGQVNGWYYDVLAFSEDIHKLSSKRVPKNAVMEMILYADEMDGDGFEILEAVTDEDIIKSDFKSGLHNFINIDRLYILKQYRNKGYATQILKTLTDDEFISGVLRLEPAHTIFGLMANPFELEKEEPNLDLSPENMDFLGDEDKKRLIDFYINNGFEQTKLNQDILYM